MIIVYSNKIYKLQRFLIELVFLVENESLCEETLDFKDVY